MTILFEDPENPNLIFQGLSSEVIKGTELAVTAPGDYTGHLWFFDGSETHPALTPSGAQAIVATAELRLGTYSATLAVVSCSSRGASTR